MFSVCSLASRIVPSRTRELKVYSYSLIFVYLGVEIMEDAFRCADRGARWDRIRIRRAGARAGGRAYQCSREGQEKRATRDPQRP